jgi:hypothetical protein
MLVGSKKWKFFSEILEWYSFFKIIYLVNYSINNSIIDLANLKTYELKVSLKFCIKLNRVFIVLSLHSCQKLLSIQFDNSNTFIKVIDFSLRNI